MLEIKTYAYIGGGVIFPAKRLFFQLFTKPNLKSPLKSIWRVFLHAVQNVFVG